MINEKTNLSPKEQKLMEKIVELEAAAINSIIVVDNKTMVSKILKAYEEEFGNDNK